VRWEGDTLGGPNAMSGDGDHGGEVDERQLRDASRIQ